ncbi:DUF2142 domain-containing protein [Nakamurella aerolata]|uniref:DUF2142 domain-containing protein n=1 Tax=Nakamurella aerolata TaxID=1656892 RepID=A0A849A5L2_9ACTN|nr:DUF2142 domain-containing protein [Nakamurella aerolata]NNG36274.1 DUF2142 domain-containing protein [Nakamurella aerolata]
MTRPLPKVPAADTAGRPGPTEGAAGAARWRHRRSGRLAVLGGTLTLLAVCLGFLLHSPTLIGPDEPFHFDRVVAAAHGDLALNPGNLHRSTGVRGAEAEYAKTQMKRNSPSWADYVATPRGDRPSLNDLGGNARDPQDATNYLTQHPPLYYAVLGGVMWLMPGADDLPVDQLVFWLRAANLLLILPLPWLFHRAARTIFSGRAGKLAFAPAAVAAAPFLPALIPGLPRLVATITNDALAISIGTAILALALGVMRGDRSVRTAVQLSVLAIAAALTKVTVILVAAAIPVAYLYQWLRWRRWPRPAVAAALVTGAALTAAWPIRNLIQFGAVLPAEQAWGSRFARVTGDLRTAANPMDSAKYWQTLGDTLASRFWGSLGLHEPPQLPGGLLWVMTLIALASVVVSVWVVPGRRLMIVLPWLLGVGMIVAVLYNAYAQYSKYTALTGIQGRYAYPAMLGLLLPIAIAAAFGLGRFRRWTATVLCLYGLLVCGWALWISAGYTWLPRGQNLTFGTLASAAQTFNRHFAFAPSFTVVVGLVALLAAGGAIASTVALARSDLPRSMPVSASVPAGSDRTF